jgi:hypothetical protein
VRNLRLYSGGYFKKNRKLCPYLIMLRALHGTIDWLTIAPSSEEILIDVLF